MLTAPPSRSSWTIADGADSASETDERRFYGELKAIGLERNYARGWAAANFRNAFGYFPSIRWNRPDDIPIATPCRATLDWVEERRVEFCRTMGARRAAGLAGLGRRPL